VKSDHYSLQRGPEGRCSACVEAVIHLNNCLGAEHGVLLHHAQITHAIQFNAQSFELIVGQESLQLSGYEGKLLAYLTKHRGAIKTRSQILDAVWGSPDSAGERQVDALIHRLRRKLSVHASGKSVIRTVKNVGYQLV